MAHISVNFKERPTTPDKWMEVGRDIGELANEWSGRGDLVAFVGPEAGKEAGAPAAFDPARAEIMVNTDVAFGKKTKPSAIVNIATRKTQFEFAKATGAMFHEAMHARYTTWDLYASAKALTPNQNAALHILEESRMEGMGVRHMPKMRNFLRSCALEIVIGDVKETADKLSDTRAAAHLAALTLARTDAGVLDDEDIIAIAVKIKDVLGEELEGKLQAIWREFQSIHRVSEPSDIKRLYDLAIEWNRLVQEAAEERGEGAERKNGNGSEGDGQDGGEMMKGIGGMLGDIMEALGEDADATAVAVGDDLGEQEKQEDYEAKAAAQNAAGKERKENQNTFQKIFKDGETPSTLGSYSEIIKSRPPTADEHIAAVTLGRELDKAKYQDRVRIEATSIMPPGRLRTRAVVQQKALRARNVQQTVEPFRRVMRKHVDDPNLTIGVQVDISGSMSAAMEPMASAAWILSEASKRADARLAMVYYGNGVFPTLKPGQHLDKVNIYSAADGTERFDLASKALDGGLDLINGTGARMVVIVSDGQYTPNERESVRKWLRAYEAAGVGVLWLAFGYADYAEDYCKERKNAEIVRFGRGDSPTKAAQAIGQAAVRAVNAAGTTRRG